MDCWRDHKWLCAAALGGGLLWLTRKRTSAEHGAATSFEAYMRSKGVAPGGTQQKRYDPADFTSYLKQGSGGAGPAAPPSALPLPAQPPAEEVPLDSKPVLVLYGTEYGFSKEVAERLAEHLRAAGYWPRLADMANHPGGMPQLGRQQALLVVCSTQGDGVPPTEARDFCDWLAGGAAPQLDGLPFSVCALGDKWVLGGWCATRLAYLCVLLAVVPAHASAMLLDVCEPPLRRPELIQAPTSLSTLCPPPVNPSADLTSTSPAAAARWMHAWRHWVPAGWRRGLMSTRRTSRRSTAGWKAWWLASPPLTCGPWLSWAAWRRWWQRTAALRAPRASSAGAVRGRTWARWEWEAGACTCSSCVWVCQQEGCRLRDGGAGLCLSGASTPPPASCGHTQLCCCCCFHRRWWRWRGCAIWPALTTRTPGGWRSTWGARGWSTSLGTRWVSGPPTAQRWAAAAEGRDGQGCSTPAGMSCLLGD